MAIPTITMSCNSLPLTAIETAANNCELDTTTKKFGSGSIKILQGGYIDVAMPSVFNMLTDSWTVEHWFSITDLETDNYHHLINADNNANGQWAVYVDNTGKLTLNRRGGTAITSTVAIANNEWHHLRVTHTGNKTLKAYLDGNLFATNTFSSAPDSMRIGKTLGESTRWYTGNIDEVALTILDSSNVAEYSGDTAPVPTEGYPDEGTSGGTGVVIGGLFLSNSKPKAGDKGLLVNNKFFIPFAESSGGGSADFYKCASVDTEAKTWSGYKAVFDSTAGTWSFSDTVTDGLTYTSVTPIEGGIYSADALAKMSLYTGAPAIPTDGLDFYLPFDEDMDEKVNSITGTLSSSSAAKYFMLSSDTAVGKFLRCIKTQGSSSYYLKYPGSESLMQYGTGDFSLSFWMRAPDWGNFTHVVFEKKYNDNYDGFVVFKVLDPLNLCCRLRKGSGEDSVDILTASAANSDKFIHWCFIRDAGGGRWYCNGLQEATSGELINECIEGGCNADPSRAIGVNVSNSEIFKIGYSASWSSKQAVFDLKALRIYNRALSDSEITELSKEFTPTA